MIYDTLNHIDNYKGIHPNVMRGLEILRDTDFSKLEDKRYEVDGDEVFFFIQTFETKEVNDTPEAHKKYVDIQYVIDGQEKMGVGPLESMEREVEARPEGDIWFYNGPLDYVRLGNGRFAAVWPGDAHAPGIAVDGPATCRKCVVKARVG